MTRAGRLLVGACCLTSAVAIASPQVRDAQTGATAATAHISGTVFTDETTPVPMRRVTLTLTGETTGVRAVAVTDDAGAFTFTNVPADRFGLLAEKGGYIPLAYGSKRPGGPGTPIVVSAGQRAAITLKMTRGSVMSGTVRGADGAPLPGVTVSVMRSAISAMTGERELQAVRIGSSLSAAGYSASAFPGTAVTDDRGAYRIFGLAPGEYLVSASVRPVTGTSPLVASDVHQISDADVRRAQQLLRGSAVGVAATVAPPEAVATRVEYAPVFHPSALSASEAMTVALGRGEERSGVDVTVRLVRTAVVSGVATRPDGTPEMGAQITLRDRPGAAASLAARRMARITRTDADGAFVLDGIRPGRYELIATTYPERLSAVDELEVSGRDISHSISLIPGMALSGGVTFDGALPPPAADSVIVILSPAPFGGPRYERSPDGRFTLHGVPAGRYRLTINGRPPAGWMLRSVELNGEDVADLAFEVRPGENIAGITVALTDKRTEIAGRFTDAAGNPAPEYVLVVFSAEQRYWLPNTRRTQHVRPDASGTFVARDLPAGDYFISAVTDIEEGQWHDPAFLAALAASNPVKVTLAEGERKVQDIRIGGAPVR